MNRYSRTLPFLSTTTVRRRGIVSSIANSFVSFAFAGSPALLLALIDVDGFRSAWRLLAAVLVAAMGTIIVVFYRDTPEGSGLVIDGGVADPDTPLIAGIGTADDMTRDRAVRDLRFWAVTVPVMALSATGTALTFHIIDFGAEVGLTDDEVVRIFIPIAIVSVPVTLIGGWLVDIVSPIAVAAAMSIAQLVMYLTVAHVDAPIWAAVAITGWGVSQGCFAPLTSAALPRLFGRRHLGSIAGVQMSLMVIGSAVGPALFALIEATAGSYEAALRVSAVVPVVGLVLAIATGRSSRSPSPQRLC